jgi:uncharacterized membrane protein
MQSREELSGYGRSAESDVEYLDFYESPSNGRRARERNRRALRTAGLGWFSVGLGLAELLAPKAVSQLIGAPSNAQARNTLRAMGLRELTSGILVLTQSQPAPALWSRVAGDFIDLALLGKASTRSSRQTRLLAATAAVVGVTVLDAITAIEATKVARSEEQSESEHRVVLSKALTINRPSSDVYAFVRDFTNQPKFMTHISSVEVRGNRSKWHARGPAGLELHWEAELIEDRPGEFIRWKSVEGASIDTETCVYFSDAPGDRGTEIHVEIRYEPPLGVAGFTLAKLFGAVPEQKLENDLRRLKQILETGEIVHSAASIHAGPHPAQPARETETKQVGNEALRVSP